MALLTSLSGWKPPSDVMSAMEQRWQVERKLQEAMRLKRVRLDFRHSLRNICHLITVMPRPLRRRAESRAVVRQDSALFSEAEDTAVPASPVLSSQIIALLLRLQSRFPRIFFASRHGDLRMYSEVVVDFCGILLLFSKYNPRNPKTLLAYDAAAWQPVHEQCSSAMPQYPVSTSTLSNFPPMMNLAQGYGSCFWKIRGQRLCCICSTASSFSICVFPRV
jgi:hypothetical protein